MESYAQHGPLRLTIVIAIFIFVNGFASAQDSLIYRINPIPENDRTNLEIDVKFRIAKNDSIKVGLIAGNYGTPNLYKYVTEFTGRNGTTVRPTEKDNERLVIANELGEINIKYVISIDPSELDGYAFAPIIHKNYFDIAGCQWLLHIGEDEKEYAYSMQLNTPEGWYVHSSLGENPDNINVQASFNDLIEFRIGGGGEVYSFNIKDKPVTIIVKGDFEIPIDQLYSAVEQIIKIQRKWFNDFEQPFFHVVINARNGVVAGTAIPNEFVCFVGNDVSTSKFNEIVAHEMFHYWLPGKIDIDTSQEEVSAKHEWLTEGFTTYFARKILLDASLLTADEFAKLFNEDILKIEDNPYKNISYTELAEDIKAGDFYSDLKNLAYHRGALIALNWELQLKKDGKPGLQNYMQAFYNLAQDQKGTISENSFLEFSNEYGVKSRADFNNYIVKGKSIKVEANIVDLLGIGFELGESSILSFDPGFDIVATKKSNTLTGVKKGANAHNAGLRNGMEYTRIRNSYRAKGWSKSRPYKIKAIVNGVEKDFEFVPYGQPVGIQQIISLNNE